MTSGGYNFIGFPENQLTKFRAVLRQNIVHDQGSRGLSPPGNFAYVHSNAGIICLIIPAYDATGMHIIVVQFAVGLSVTVCRHNVPYIYYSLS